MEDLSEEEQVMMKQAELVLMSNALPGKGQRIFLVWANLNWGPPVGGRYDTDHFTIWAAVPRDVSVQQVRIFYKPLHHSRSVCTTRATSKRGWTVVHLTLLRGLRIFFCIVWASLGDTLYSLS
eukprot:TRINITY_DN1661_c0_g1_i3.p1 TRINITY_DN1661_c0_g1~~TRINITY_DN1661_c0_g1_i3.p1  ORF type:complete len:123 (+),score=23.45 TRINITY_DN1661_c0_g1_i3:173-541(+)